MASLGHIAVGLAAGRGWADLRQRSRILPMLGFSMLAMLPDADVISFKLGIAYADPFGHRGASHALASAFALGLLIGLFAWAFRHPRPLALGLLSALVTASHGVLDAMTTGGLGAALLWPWDEARYFLPWRPIPVSPIGSHFISERGLRVATTELLLFAPFWIWALRPSFRTRSKSPASSG